MIRQLSLSRLHPALATAVMRRLVPDLVGEVTDVRFEHSPGRGHPAFTADHTAFDVLIRCTTPRGRRAFVAIEVMYTGAPGGVASPERSRYDTLSQAARSLLLARPRCAGPAPRTGRAVRLGQLFMTAMLEWGLYEEGRLLFIAPTLNTTALGSSGIDMIADRVTDCLS